MDTTRDKNQKLIVETINENTTKINIKKEDLFEVAKQLHTQDNLAFEHLSFITAVDFIDYFELVYLFYSYKRKKELTLKTSVLKKEPVIDSLTSIWIAADWPEREVYDLFGIEFKGHPNLKRIMLADDFSGHPLRKDFPCENKEEYLLK